MHALSSDSIVTKVCICLACCPWMTKFKNGPYRTHGFYRKRNTSVLMEVLTQLSPKLVVTGVVNEQRIHSFKNGVDKIHSPYTLVTLRFI